MPKCNWHLNCSFNVGKILKQFLQIHNKSIDTNVKKLGRATKSLVQYIGFASLKKRGSKTNKSNAEDRKLQTNIEVTACIPIKKIQDEDPRNKLE